MSEDEQLQLLLVRASPGQPIASGPFEICLTFSYDDPACMNPKGSRQTVPYEGSGFINALADCVYSWNPSNRASGAVPQLWPCCHFIGLLWFLKIDLAIKFIEAAQRSITCFCCRAPLDAIT